MNDIATQPEQPKQPDVPTQPEQFEPLKQSDESEQLGQKEFTLSVAYVRRKIWALGVSHYANVVGNF